MSSRRSSLAFRWNWRTSMPAGATSKALRLVLSIACRSNLWSSRSISQTIKSIEGLGCRWGDDCIIRLFSHFQFKMPIEQIGLQYSEPIVLFAMTLESYANFLVGFRFKWHNFVVKSQLFHVFLTLSDWLPWRGPLKWGRGVFRWNFKSKFKLIKTLLIFFWKNFYCWKNLVFMS